MTKQSDPPKSSVSLFGDYRQIKKSDEPDTLAPGKLRMVITYLEMRKPPIYPRTSTRAENLSIIRAYDPGTGFYRYLYNAVGKDWLWYERNLLSDEELEKIIHHPKVRLYVLYLKGTPAGYCELDFRVNREVEIAYFGLLPEFTGRGLGTYFLHWGVKTAWSENPKRVWVHTCNFDSPHALATYQKAGFSVYRQEAQIIDDPRIDLNTH
ncbi:MAG: GNAT family N-acetyltransferase [Acidiferrobacterales bacterium]|nr:GNAT family N-acetyltransferase [Acidiferrobacterales bacterium]